MVSKILIVDDDLYIRELYEELLKGEKYEVDTAVDGEEGLNKISKGGYDLVLLDIMMPKIDGLGILQKLKENPPKVPNKAIVVLTNLANDPVVEETTKLGAKSYYIKSDHTPEEFLKNIKKWLS